MKKNNKIKQNTPEWEHLRKTHLTGTILKGIMGTKYARQEAMYEMIANRLTTGVDSDEEYENPMDRGHRLEPDAIAAFEFETGKSVDRTGFCEHDETPQISNSPDGLIGEDEAIEVKCPLGKNYVKMWLTNEVPAEYYWQTIQYFSVNEKLKKLYLVGYHPQIPVHSLHIIEIKRSDVEEDIVKARVFQKDFLEEVEEILNKIITL